MKIGLIIRNIDENFKNSSANIKIANSTEHLKTINLKEALLEFKKLKVECELFIIDMMTGPVYYLAAKKEMGNEKGKIRTLKTVITNSEILINIDEKVIEGYEDIILFT